MPTLREKVAGLLRQLSSGVDTKCESSSACTSPTTTAPPESFIQKYLNGQVKRNQPEILFAKSCYDLPIKKVARLSKHVQAAYSGPAGGLTEVNKKQKAFEYLDLDVDFIDEDFSESCDNINRLVEEKENINLLQNPDKAKIENSQKNIDFNCLDDKEEIAGIKNWNHPSEKAYGIATTLYERHPVTRENAGEPVADAFAVAMRDNSAILALADGVNWGEKACLAARCAIHGSMDYLNKALYSEGSRVENTMDVFVCLLRSFHAAHNLILQENGQLTTLCAAFICQLRNSEKFIVCSCNVGDSLAYVYSKKHGVREITQGSHDIHSMRDMRDALGALGPVDGQNPELNNLTVSMTIVEPGDIVFLTSDGISDNFDPVVGKFAIPKKPDKSNCNRPAAETKNDNAKNAAGIKRQNSNSQDIGLKRQNNHTHNILRRSNSANHGHGLRRNNSNLNEKEILFFEPTLPVVEAHQRHDLTLLRMEDLLNNGVHEDDSPCDSAQKLCEELIDFAMKLTVAKRRILEDPELYTQGDPDTQVEQRSRRRKVGEKLASVPGKLDHASVVAYKVGNYKTRSPFRRTKEVKQSVNNNIIQQSSTDQQRFESSI